MCLFGGYKRQEETALADLTQARVIITGAATGIGLATARHLYALGSSVALLDINAEAVSDHARRLDPTGQRATGLEVDVASPESVEAACTGALDKLGGVDVLVNGAAGFTPNARITEQTIQEWTTAIQIDLTGVFLMCRQIIPVMRSGSAIVNLASQLGSVGSAGRASYCAAKGGIIQLTKVLALDHAADGIRVNSVSPGAIVTQRIIRRFGSEQAARDQLTPLHPIGRLGEADEIARAIAFVASDDAAFMTGSDLLVDGGYNAL